MLILTLRIWIRFLFGMHPYIELITYYQYQIVKKNWRITDIQDKIFVYFSKIAQSLYHLQFLLYHISADLCYNK